MSGRHLLLITLLLAGNVDPGHGAAMEEAVKARLFRLLNIAITYDLYNGRCRGFISSMHTDNVETLTVEKFSMTLSQLSDAVASRPLSTLRRDAETMLMQRILALGGCRATKRRGYLHNLQNDYQQLYDWLTGYP